MKIGGFEDRGLAAHVGPVEDICACLEREIQRYAAPLLSHLQAGQGGLYQPATWVWLKLRQAESVFFHGQDEQVAPAPLSANSIVLGEDAGQWRKFLVQFRQGGLHQGLEFV